MAAVVGSVTAQIEDINPTVRAVKQNFNCSSGLLADMESYAAAWLGVLDPVVGGLITKAHLTIPLTLPGGLKSAPTALVNNAIIALIGWLSGASTDIYGVGYPGWYTTNPGNGFEVANQGLVNQSDTDVLAFLTFQSSGPVNNCTFVTEDLGAVDGLRYAIKRNRTTRKQLPRAK